MANVANPNRRTMRSGAPEVTVVCCHGNGQALSLGAQIETEVLVKRSRLKQNSCKGKHEREEDESSQNVAFQSERPLLAADSRSAGSCGFFQRGKSSEIQNPRMFDGLFFPLLEAKS